MEEVPSTPLKKIEKAQIVTAFSRMLRFYSFLELKSCGMSQLLSRIDPDAVSCSELAQFLAIVLGCQVIGLTMK